jgi:hypothetical protein
MELALPKRAQRLLSDVVRRVSLLTRKSVYQQSAFLALRDAIAVATRAHFGRGGR